MPIYTFSNKKFTVTRGLYISERTQSKRHYKIVKQLNSNWMCEFQGDLCKLFDWETLINKKDKNSRYTNKNMII